MRSNLKINYGDLDEMFNRLSDYLSSCMIMRSAIGNIDLLLKDSKGEAVDALRESYLYTASAIDAYQNRIIDLRNLINDYTTEMTREIQPISRPLMTQACPNNTYWGINAMDTRINTYQFSRNTCH